jgi:putative Mg2+ transporter-C (MgtC) family protein
MAFSTENIFYLEALFKLAIVFVISFLFGYNRQRAHKPIGFGTYIFVALGACSLGIVAHVIAPENPLPLLAAVISGIGFLGAGALIKTSDKVFGFSSAAGIWVFAILGLLVGVGQYYVSMLVYALTWAVLFFDKWLEKEGIGSYQKRVLLTTNRIVSEKDIEGALAVGSVKLKKINIDVSKKDNQVIILYQLQGRKEDINQIPQRLYEKTWFSSFKVE